MSRPFGTPIELERRRWRALELLQQGEKPNVIAHFLGVDRSSVYRWKKAADRSPDALVAQPHPHRPARLSDRQLEHLERLLIQGPAVHGWPNQLWTTQRVATLIERHFHIRYHHDHVGRFLRQRLNWSVQKPLRRARERDEDAILTWQSERFPSILHEAQERGAHLVFLDESGYFLTPTVRRTWAPQGQTPILHAWDRHDRISAISCITVSPKNQSLNLYFELLADRKNAHGEDIVAYLKRLKAQLGTPLTILWDGSRIHDRCQAVKDFLAEHPEIRTERLPAYAPELNPDELVWAWTKYSRLGNLAAADTAALRDFIQTELNYLRRHPDLLAAFIDKSLPNLWIG